MDTIFPWNQLHWQQVTHLRQENRLPHALLCGGPPGMGKTSFVQQLANTLLCEEPQTDGFACGDCKSCHLFKSGNHPDLSLVQPIEPGKKIQVEQIRELIQFCALTARYAGYQVVIIQPAEAMNLNATNSLLKLLEEPPAKTVLLLISHRPQTLLATVRSRCQRLDFNRIDSELAQTWLKTQLSPEQDVQLLLKLSNYAPLTARALASPDILMARQQLFTSLVQLLTQDNDPIQVAAQWNTLEIKQTLTWMLSWTMDLIRLRASGQTQHVINRDWQVALQPLSAQWTLQSLFKMLDLQKETYRLITYTNSIKPQGLLESIAIAWLELNTKRR